MTHITYADLILSFTPTITGNGITQTKMNAVIENMYLEASEVLGHSSDIALCHDLIQADASKQFNDWNGIKKDGNYNVVYPSLTLSDGAKARLLYNKGWSAEGTREDEDR